MSEWISVEDRLPEEDDYVLCFTTIDNHITRNGIQNIKIASLCKGISEKERRSLIKRGDVRGQQYTSSDVWGNNLKPYNWSSFGAGDYFGQEVTHWMPLPEPPRANNDS